METQIFLLALYYEHAIGFCVSNDEERTWQPTIVASLLRCHSYEDVTIAFKSALDKLAEDDDIDPYKTVFSFDSS